MLKTARIIICERHIIIITVQNSLINIWENI